MNNFIYSIEGFFPHLERFGSYKFNVHLDKKLAKNLFEKPLPEELERNLQESAKIIIKESRVLGLDINIPYFFVDNKNDKSCLLQGCIVPGNACDLGIDIDCFFEESLNNFKVPLIFRPHNVDSVNQAYSLLSVWLNWIENVKYLK